MSHLPDDAPPVPWWQAPAGQEFNAYYRTLREKYDMPALEAYQTARSYFRRYPNWFADPVATTRAAIAGCSA